MKPSENLLVVLILAGIAFVLAFPLAALANAAYPGNYSAAFLSSLATSTAIFVVGAFLSDDEDD